MHRYRSHTCAALRKSDVGSTVRLSGWVHRVRDHGGVLFIDLRDHYGMTQVVADPDSPAFKAAETVRGEWVIRVDGAVKARTDETVNRNMPTGEVELYAREIEVLSAAKELPLPVFGEPDYPEDVRLKYRFLDLRRETLHKNIVRRTEIIAAMRRRMSDIGFTEYTTPILTASSPEGARDFLVPSRIHPGNFYALPQAPQQYKQLLMVAGFDRYFQIAPCFRDEDPRADRLPGEFYQLDLEMSFVEQEDVWDAMEPMIRAIFADFAGGKPVTDKFPRIPYDAAIRKYGSDKPDLRNPIEMQEVTEHFAGSGFKVFANMIASNPKVEIWAIPAKTGGSRAFCDRMNAWAQSQGQPGLGYIFWRKEGEKLEGAGPLAKNIGEERTDAIRTQLGLGDGDACFFVAGEPAKFYKFAGEARTRAGEELNLVDRERYELCWIVDFPFYEWNEEEKRVDFAHNPFSMPQGGLTALSSDDLLSIKAFQYDMVCNGFEIASGSIRNQSPELMVKAFENVGLSQADVEERFGGLYRAFQYGAPPHGGMAFGIDRIVMLLVGAKNLREISLFPMNQQAQDLLMGAPSPAEPAQLRELAIRPVPQKKD
ncbi:aspartate--tRNA ligase [Sinorhizobium medicae]|uniref:Aspartate--tRNA(Asp/Asn) ligase n=2 Tax=Sinorhizobium medicae TaxID=110321 RepID=SYDND_SINMW|nr:aspartate--tRNA ligase [Sinorhizobium medicae]A6U7M8.1 RecName: Full=Aspartate--tRNA(Asp/Asn) ligase; AltName: Full=Aspartyl-tRNA synthetase; Short=AspRS; AltName: Full=Non-discriminating aspartyl-tRNA synthetase; Short=ND-AspRS [Sinorhizobium medicae WSM419]ABR59658.1 aspartyl-tRNA synthetase [Sinorhizobium medicae WSM419]MBO1963058.1 aspartate--tRNA ligase [Sinorhizobium medicae]MDX0404284.1 aspartate--tRNA ligase [Sinorhizobium medicae]MDX0410221.1 aspartate--tRNA ligase [Sinorhizobium m